MGPGEGWALPGRRTACAKALWLEEACEQQVVQKHAEDLLCARFHSRCERDRCEQDRVPSYGVYDLGEGEDWGRSQLQPQEMGGTKENAIRAMRQ